MKGLTGGKKLICNTFNTKYKVVHEAASNHGYKIVSKDHNLAPSSEIKEAHRSRLAPGLYSLIQPEDFDVAWFDLPITADVLSKLKPHQRVS